METLDEDESDMPFYISGPPKSYEELTPEEKATVTKQIIRHRKYEITTSICEKLFPYTAYHEPLGEYNRQSKVGHISFILRDKLSINQLETINKNYKEVKVVYYKTKEDVIKSIKFRGEELL